ncbi:C-GCAxxG-C-C family protein [Desulfoplanes formicivorans]|uniref:Redox-active protein n=1 Tax=Desulfoplanes formicivorans TaxID=1592317 RepID=A0A194AHL2_9BACT|nr:C-GCAxxG-C-C family protein [Desulfoplanes formicivorans]GAU08249.1 hypothetical protein DPF_0952 [Desulfoplanes formicivorans]
MDQKELIQKRISVYYWQDDINCAAASLKVLGEICNVTICDQVIDAATGMHGAGEYGAQCGLVEGPLMFLGIWGRNRRHADREIAGWCHAFARQFEERFHSLLCRELRPRGFGPHNPGHPCECLTCNAIALAVEFVAALDGRKYHVS